jgi:outer membrane protein OmpA-like peptidoglycan-associated protein
VKSVESKTKGAQPKNNTSFFGKESGQHFFQPGRRAQPFFSKGYTHAKVSEAESPEQIQKCAACEQEEKQVQKKPAGSGQQNASPQIESSLNASKGSGSPLPDQTRGEMESSFGADFSGVKVHTDNKAVQLNKELNAQAFTYGNNIYFNTGKYNTDHTAGKHLLAHELTHVVQQSNSQHQGNGIKKSGKDCIQAKGQIATIFPDKDPPKDNQCHVFLGGRRIDHWSGIFPGMRHLYIDYYKNNSDYGIIEAGPVPESASMGGGTSGAWAKPSKWESRGVQWEISRDDCPAFIDCLKNQTTTYNGASHPYHATNGPNSNSFAWWVLNECGTNISFLISSYPYLGVDYWQNHSATASTGSSTAPATPIQKKDASPLLSSDKKIQKGPGPGETGEKRLSRPEEIALSLSSPGQFTAVPSPLTLSLYNFGIDVSQPKAEHLAVLNELALLFKQVATATAVVKVLGFADSTGPDEYNFDLSKRRALAVDAILESSISQHISRSAFGETNPVASNDTVEGRNRNRRVDLRFNVQKPPVQPPGTTPPPGPGTDPPGGGKDHGSCEKHPILCDPCSTLPLLCAGGGIPFLLPLICLIAPEVCAAVTCILNPELCLTPPPPPKPPPPKPPETPKKDDHGPMVLFTPIVRANNTPAGMNDRIGLRDPVHIMAMVINPPPSVTPITIFVSGSGPDGGTATINGQPQVQITGSTALEIKGTQMSREGYPFNPFLQLGAWWSNTTVGESNRFSVSSIAENWSVIFGGAKKERFGYVFLADMDWVSDSGSYKDLDACYYVEFVGVIDEQGGMKGFGIGDTNDPINASPADLHPAYDEHGTPFEYTKVAGSSRLKQLFGIRDDRSNSGWAASPNSGFEIVRRFERDPDNPRCWHLILEKKGAAVTVNGMSSGAGSGSIRHVFDNINCDPAPPPPPGKDDPIPVVPTVPPVPKPPDDSSCNSEELSKRVDKCIEQAKKEAIECTLAALPMEEGPGGVAGGVYYLICLEKMRERLLECDKKAKEDTHCKDDDTPRMA